jgi:hypothetical protein
LKGKGGIFFRRGANAPLSFPPPLLGKERGIQGVRLLINLTTKPQNLLTNPNYIVIIVNK